VFRQDQKENHYHRSSLEQPRPKDSSSIQYREQSIAEIKTIFQFQSQKVSLTTELAVRDGADWPNAELRIRCKL
jgi:hypothetical protein